MLSSGERKKRNNPEDNTASNYSKKPKGKSALKTERKEAAELDEERKLTALLFGGSSDNIKPSIVRHESTDLVDRDRPLFEIDRAGVELDNDVHDLSNNEDKVIDDSRVKDEDQEGPAWVDEDDANLEVDLLATSRLRKLRTERAEQGTLSGVEAEKRLRERFQNTAQLTAHVDWARVEDKDSEDIVDNEEFINSSESLLQNPLAKNRLQAQTINIMRCPDVNLSDPNNAVVQVVQFHPGSDSDRPLLLTAGLDKTLRFFQVGEDKSQKVHGIHFPKLPIYSASFLGSTGNVVVSGRRPFFYIYDSIVGKLELVPKIQGREEKSLEKCVASPDGQILAFLGNDGYVILFDAKAKQWITDLKLNGNVRAVTFTPEGDQILASGSDGDVYRWDMRTHRCVERFANEDGTITSSLAASARNLAVGAESGVVNMYSEHVGTNLQKMSMTVAKAPTKSIMNLHTSADIVKFNSDGQILAISSRRETNGLKLLHVPTATVFSNWPTTKTPLNYVWSLDFSPDSRFLAVGNDKGKCLLYKLLHYSNS